MIRIRQADEANFSASFSDKKKSEFGKGRGIF